MPIFSVTIMTVVKRWIRTEVEAPDADTARDLADDDFDGARTLAWTEIGSDSCGCAAGAVAELFQPSARATPRANDPSKGE